MFVAKTLNALPEVTAFHEGHLLDGTPTQRLPLINLQNRKAWNDAAYAEKTVDELRSKEVLEQAAGGASLLVDVAFNNAPFLVPLANRHPTSGFVAIFRQCEGFVRSATIVSGEDTQPAGWPDRDKPLTDREKFISLGRLKPNKDSAYFDAWTDWSAIQRNIWLWTTVNTHLANFVKNGALRRKVLFEDLIEEPDRFWVPLLQTLDVSTEANRKKCMELSTKKTNQRASYQIGPVSEWSPAERALYEELARPLEDTIYG
ncbi:hypothetical protein [Sulfitobacter sp. SK011]|uniref:hypothetical protein n=1 Tax=Sulfitobacter sp. SK011 TaxID=1389004 RepID=UPI000E103C6B|nr:hypothetical protein [Sulfitobacter sp. SK011]AXI43193.1 hypothetical protein C1J02_15535 [Sulfitobacter sp. SK011]